MLYLFVLIVGVFLSVTPGWAQQQCIAFDPDYCVNRICGEGNGDCDPGQCAAGLVCVNDVGAQYGLPAHYDVCERPGGATDHPDPDYCVNNYCGIGDGDCDPGQCDEGVCVNDVGAEYGLPSYYDVCEAGDTGGGGSGGSTGSTSDQQKLQSMRGTWNFTLTVVEPAGQQPVRRSYAVTQIDQGGALGRDPVDQSTFGIVILDSPLIFEGGRYPLFMLDVDAVGRNYICSAYYLSPSGNRLNGVFALIQSRGPNLTQCDPNSPIAVGTLTGTRR